MNQWLDCLVSQGQFTGEYAVKGALHDGTEFSLFASEEDVSVQNPLTEDGRVSGRIRVERLSEKDNLILISLPQPTFENGKIITVKNDQVHPQKTIEENRLFKGDMR